MAKGLSMNFDSDQSLSSLGDLGVESFETVSI